MTQTSVASVNRCPWCGEATRSATGNCPRCGAPLAVAVRVDQSGFEQRPAIADMARLQFGPSTCQIEGEMVPVADFHLAPNDFIYFSHHQLLWADSSITLRNKSMHDAWKRMIGGMPIFLTEAVGPGHVAVSADQAGETIAIPLDAGATVDVHENHFLAATSEVNLNLRPTDIWIGLGESGEEEKTKKLIRPIGMFYDRFVAGEKPGIVFVHCRGNCFVQTLQPDQAILIKPGAFLYKDPQVKLWIHIEYISLRALGFPGGVPGARLWLRAVGPGRIAVQSNYTQTELIREAIVNSSYNTYGDS
jgi:uncharacterized protein (AIM24 family)